MDLSHQGEIQKRRRKNIQAAALYFDHCHTNKIEYNNPFTRLLFSLTTAYMGQLHGNVLTVNNSEKVTKGFLP